MIVGGGGHGLATAYYLAKNHGMTNIAVLERGWLAGGNMARNTTIIRSNYLWDESAAIYEHSLKLWEGLPEELEYDFLFSQRGVMNLAHTLQDVRESSPPGRAPTSSTASTPSGWTPEQVKELCPIINISDNIRYPVHGRDLPAPRRHRQARPRRLGVRPQVRRAGRGHHPELRGHRLRQGRQPGRRRRDQPRPDQRRQGGPGRGRAQQSVLAELAGFELPIQSHPLQALVSELHEPVHPTVVMSNHVHVYVSQAHKGELVMGAGIDSYNGYGQRGAFHVIEQQMAAAVELFPIFARAHVLRTWGGIVDVTLDASPIIGPTPVDEPLRQLRLGNRRVQGHPGRRLDVRPHHRHR